MALELIHTSALTGLHGRATGFCTVAMTTGMPALLEERLESLGGYRALGAGAVSPPSFSHLRLEVGDRRWHVLSALRAAPPDPSGRANKLVHHLVLAPDERVDAGPAWLLRQPHVVIDHFDGAPRWIPSPRMMPDSGPVSPRRASAWERATGDAGWAGVLANHSLLDPGRISCIVHDAEIDALELVDEALSLLPPAFRWRVTFATHFQQAVAGVPCAWRFCIAGTPAALEASRRATGLYLDVSDARRERARAKEGRYTDLARSGAAAWWSREAPDGTREHGGEPGGSVHGARDETDVFSGSEPLGTTSSRDNERSPRATEELGGGNAVRARGSLASAGGRSSADDARAVSAMLHRAEHAGSDDRSRGGRTLAFAVILLVAILLSAVGAIVVDRFWSGRTEQSAMVRDRMAQLEAERDELRAESNALRGGLEGSQSRLVDATARERALLAERDDLRRNLSSAEDRLRAYEGLARADGAAAPGVDGADPSVQAGSTVPAQPVAPSGPTTPVQPVVPTGPTSPSGPTTPPGGAPLRQNPTLAADDALIIFPSDGLTRQVSHLGVISGERRTLLTLPQSIKSIAVHFPSAFTTLSTTANATGSIVTLYTASAGSGSGARRAAATVEASGAALGFRWEASLSPLRHASILESLDSAIPFVTIVVTLEDGSTRRLAPAPIQRDAPVGRGAPATSALGAGSSALRLTPAPLDGWTLDAARSTATQLTLVHGAGTLQATLDPAHGRIGMSFLSPVHDEYDAAQRELKLLEADRAKIPPEERAFHESAIRAARERVETLREQIESDALAIPTVFPSISVEDQELARVVVIIRPVPAGAPRGGASP